jgi:hypothetical protein
MILRDYLAPKYLNLLPFRAVKRFDVTVCTVYDRHPVLMN